MAVDSDNLNFYECLTWTEGSTHGGDINLANKILDDEFENIFDSVTDSERIAGDTDYRKIYIRNDNVGDNPDWNQVRCWISQFTLSTDDEIWITIQGTDADTQADATAYTYYQPDAIDHVDVLNLGNIVTLDYHHVWIKRVVSALSNKYPANSFILGFRSAV